MKENVFCIDIGGTHTKLGIVEKQSGEILFHDRVPTNADKPVTDLIARVQEIYEHQKSKFPCIGIGIGAPNCHYETGIMVSPPNFTWDKVNLAQAFSQGLGLPTKIDNDANIAALGEKRFGKGSNLTNFIVVTLGTGVGTGLIINSEIYRGTSQLAGEGGHMTIIPNGRICPCSRPGHLEAYCGAVGIEKTHEELFSTKIGFREIRDKFVSGDKQAYTTIEETMTKLALGLSNFQSLLDFDMILLTGGVTSLGNEILKMLNNKINDSLFPNFKTHTKIEFCSTPYKYGALHGACALFLKETN